MAFADLADTLTLQPGGEAALDIAGPFAAACGPAADNLVLKAHGRAARACRRAQGRAFRAGEKYSGRGRHRRRLGRCGGGACGCWRAPTACRSTIRGWRRPRSRSAPTCRSVSIRARASCAASARSSRRRSICRSLPALLVNPGVPLATRDVFAKHCRQASQQAPIRRRAARRRDALIAFLDAHGNDLTQPAIACAPVIADVLSALSALPGARLARMSGSGADLFCAVSHPADAAAAAPRAASRAQGLVGSADHAGLDG